ncbi:MAG: hypothetical protein WBC04_18965 [Candidatus Acidiferrales bacterium]
MGGVGKEDRPIHQQKARAIEVMQGQVVGVEYQLAIGVAIADSTDGGLDLDGAWRFFVAGGDVEGVKAVEIVPKVGRKISLYLAVSTEILEFLMCVVSVTLSGSTAIDRPTSIALTDWASPLARAICR